MTNKISKIIALHKTAQDQTDLMIWARNHPIRYSDDQIGFDGWRLDISDALGISDAENISAILNGEVSWDTISAVRSWADIATLFPRGNEIRERWQDTRQNKGLGAFLAWFDKTQPKTADQILDGISAIPTSAPILSGKKPISNRHEEDKKESIHAESGPDDKFYKTILIRIGAPVTKNNLSYLWGWRQAEGGHAAFNPFNTTQKAPGAGNYNSVGVKNYVSEDQGIEATVKTLLNGRYNQIIEALRSDSDPMETAEALVASPWGTGELAKKVISGYQSGAKPAPKPIGRVS